MLTLKRRTSFPRKPPSSHSNDFLTDRGHSVAVLFFTLFFYVFKVQLLMQIIISRIAVIVDNRRLIAKVKVQTDRPHKTSLILTSFSGALLA